MGGPVSNQTVATAPPALSRPTGVAARVRSAGGAMVSRRARLALLTDPGRPRRLGGRQGHLRRPVAGQRPAHLESAVPVRVLQRHQPAASLEHRRGVLPAVAARQGPDALAVPGRGRVLHAGARRRSGSSWEPPSAWPWRPPSSIRGCSSGRSSRTSSPARRSRSSPSLRSSSRPSGRASGRWSSSRRTSSSSRSRSR